MSWNSNSLWRHSASAQGCKWCKYVDTCTIHDAWIIIQGVPGAGWHSLMLSLCHGWHRHNASTWPAQHCHTDRIRETEKRALNWFPTDTISLCKCDNIDAMYSSRILRLIDHALLLSITSFSEKIGSGETHECNDGAPLFRLMDCSCGAIFRRFWVSNAPTSHQTPDIQSPFYIVWDNNRNWVLSGSTEQGITQFRTKLHF